MCILSTNEYLKPCLQGYRLAGEGTYVRIDVNAQDRLECQQLGLTLEVDADGQLVIRDTFSGEALLTEAESLARRNLLIEQEILRLRRELGERDRLGVD